MGWGGMRLSLKYEDFKALGWGDVACSGMGLKLTYDEFKILQWGGVGLDPMCGYLKILLISENTMDFCSLNFEFQSSLECSLWEGILAGRGICFFLNCLWQQISLFHALFLTLLYLEEGNVFAFFMRCS